MKYENIKNLILTILVVISGVLTWSIWTYQPHYDTIQSELVHEVSISDQKDISVLIKPMKVLYHQTENHYGTVKEEKIDKWLTEIQDWNFYDIEDGKALNAQDLMQLLQGRNTVEIVYPNVIPFDLYKNVLHFDGKSNPSFDFDRIIIQFPNEEYKDSAVYFIHDEERKIYESHVNSDIAVLETQLLAEIGDYEPYIAHKINETKTIFLPEAELKMTSYKYLPDFIELDKFKYALFGDPSSVKKDKLPYSDEFKNDTSLMTADHIYNKILYVNADREPDLSVEKEFLTSSKDLLKRSIDFVNEHGGWTDNYHYFSLDQFEQKVIFRLFLEGYPVFNEDEMAEIKQYWGKEEIFKYTRPYFSLNIPLPSESQEVVLPNGETALNMLLADDAFEPEMLHDMVIGYKMSKDSQHDKVLTFEPSWYYNYAGSWVRLSTDDIGGLSYGLE